MEKLDGKTRDVVQDNIEKLKQLFPEVFTEEKIDFEKLQLVLGENIETEKERYEFTWNGKTEAIQLAQKQSTGTLRPCKEESVDWDTTENLYIEGDNLEVLRLLQNSYRNKVKMIYIDPPYNTGKDFVYKDNFHDNVKNYKESMDESYKSNAETNGRYHTDWLNMMYPRLKIAKNFLRDDGVIIIHIDEHEEKNLIVIMNEIYGEHNHLGNVIWDKLNPKGDSTDISVQHETIVCYAKNKIEFAKAGGIKREKPIANKMLEKAEELFSKLGTEYIPEELLKVSRKYSIPDEFLFKHRKIHNLESINSDYLKWIKGQENITGGEAGYSKIDEYGNVYQTVSMAWPNNKKAPDDYFIPLIHPTTGKECPIPAKGWRNPSRTMKKLLDNNEIVFGIDESTQPRRKYLLKNNIIENFPSVIPFGASDANFFKGINLSFDNPKPYKLAMQLISSVSDENDLILDFFSGSATSAQAVMELNLLDSKKRGFIQVQLPEILNVKSDMYKSGFRTITEIGKERIRRAGQKIKEDNRDKEGIEDLDIGFKVFKLDETNLKIWDEEVKDIEDNLLFFESAVKEGRSQEDVLYEILLKYGLDLTLPIEEEKIGEVTAFSVGLGYLIVCLDKNLSTNDIERLISNYPDCERMVFLDNGFATDEVKINAEQILKRNGVQDIRVI